MARITKKQKDDVRYYGWEKDLSPAIADACNTHAEIDAMIQCMWFVEENTNRYHHAVEFMSKDSAKKARALDNKLSKAKSAQQKHDIIKEWRAISPWYSDIKVIKNDVLDTCIDIMKDAGIDKYHRKLIIPLLTWHLMHDDDLLQSPNQDLVDLIESF